MEREGVGVMSGGRRSVERALRELRELEVRCWSEPVPAHQQDELDMPRFNVYVDPSDQEIARRWWMAGQSPAGREAADADHREHEERIRRLRPGIEVWFEDVDEHVLYDILSERMTVEQARELRAFLADGGATDRAVARWVQQRFTDEWRVGSRIAGHQGFGIAVQDVAAHKLGEHLGSPPWN